MCRAYRARLNLVHVSGNAAYTVTTRTRLFRVAFKEILAAPVTSVIIPQQASVYAYMQIYGTYRAYALIERRAHI